MKKKNILLFFTDQQRADTIGALGNSVIKTPNLDRICREGTVEERNLPAAPHSGWKVFDRSSPTKNRCYFTSTSFM